jgi:hypothetical protein
MAMLSVDLYIYGFLNDVSKYGVTRRMSKPNRAVRIVICIVKDSGLNLGQNAEYPD